MSDLLSALLLGILEGLTEFLPISSTGHLLIAQHWLGARSDFFNIVIQAGAIVAVVLVFRQRLLQLATGLNQRENREYVFKLGAAFWSPPWSAWWCARPAGRCRRRSARWPGH